MGWNAWFQLRIGSLSLGCALRRTLVGNLLHALTMSTSKLPTHIWHINMPGICVTVQAMMDALEKVGGKDKLSLLQEKSDPVLLPILKSWPTRVDNSQAFPLGFKRDNSFEQAVRDHKEGLSLCREFSRIPQVA